MINNNSATAITVVDSSVVIYQLESLINGFQGDIETATHHYIKLMLCGCYFPNNRIVMVNDLKVDGKYWRHYYLSPMGINYKGGRKEKRSQWFEVARAFLNKLSQLGIPILGFPGYEADDVAALVTQVVDNVDLFTVDTDWMGLIDESRGIRWLNSAQWTPRVRDNMESFNVWCERKFKRSFDTPRQLWDYKAEYGDKSDNLPKGSPLEVIDLIKPPMEYNLANQYQAVNRAEYAVKVAMNQDFSRLDPVDSIAALQSAGLSKGIFWSQQ